MQLAPEGTKVFQSVQYASSRLRAGLLCAVLLCFGHNNGYLMILSNFRNSEYVNHFNFAPMGEANLLGHAMTKARKLCTPG
jgi:hypothetical protein